MFAIAISLTANDGLNSFTEGVSINTPEETFFHGLARGGSRMMLTNLPGRIVEKSQFSEAVTSYQFLLGLPVDKDLDTSLLDDKERACTIALLDDLLARGQLTIEHRLCQLVPMGIWRLVFYNCESERELNTKCIFRHMTMKTTSYFDYDFLCKSKAS